MRRLRLTRDADRDIGTIFDYGVERFGETVAGRYRDGMKTIFASLLAFPFSGRARPEIRPELRSRLYGSHVVFYIVDDETVRIVRVLHGSMRAETWL